MRYGIFVFATALGMGPVAGAHADVTVASETVNVGGAATPRTIYLTATQIKVDMPKMALIFQVGSGKLMNVMKEKKEYMEIDVKALGARISGATAMMKQGLQSMPEAQRKMVEAMMAQHGASPDAPKIAMSYEKTGESKTIGSWPCQVFHQKRGGKQIADACIAKADDVGLTPDDLASLRALAETAIKSMPDVLKNNVPVTDFDDQARQIGFVGIPVELVVYANGAAVSTTTVKSIDHAPISADTFVIPADYAKKKMPGVLGVLGGQ
jgi:hypothetical protein